MPLIEINSDLSEATKQLKRIADCLVELLRLQGIHLEPVRADMSTVKDVEEVEYMSDEATFRQVLTDIHDGRNPNRPIDIDEA